MQVDKIEIGTVIDHIPAGAAQKVMKMLAIDNPQSHRAAIMLNVPSKKRGTKDILKIEGRIFDEGALNAIALIAPEATVNIVLAGKISKKFGVKLPTQITGFGKCPNGNCISHESTAKFKLETKERYRCQFCDRIFEARELI
ncbi:aspartate carbamoyltransferase regulatory subunit [Candidatus Micrarchaeota archaeon]|nr:aspartate carbamoyltransferase regulatory subunit [Candidatus Micrarchaeota archaeon]